MVPSYQQDVVNLNRIPDEEIDGQTYNEQTRSLLHVQKWGLLQYILTKT